MKIYTITLVLLIVTFSCKPRLICGTYYPVDIKSEVTKLELAGIADTTIAYVSGSMLESYEKKYRTDVLPGGNIKLVNKQNQVIFETISNDAGNYKLQLSAGIYDIEVSGMNLNNIIIRDVKIGTGYMIKLDATLGSAGENGNTTIYQMKEDRSLIEIQQPKK